MKKLSLIVLAVASSLIITACSSDKEATNQEAETQVEENAANEDSTTDVNAEVAAKLEDAKKWVLERTDAMLSNTEILEEAIIAGDYEKAKSEAWLAAQLEYEKGEALFATLSPELDDVIDVRTDSGFHGIEHILWGDGNPADSQDKLLEIIAQLKEDTKKLKQVVEEAEFDEKLMFEAMTGILPELYSFVEEVYTGESVSGTRIEDARNVFEGVTYFYDAVSPKVVAASQETDRKVRDQIEHVNNLMAEEKPDVNTVEQEFGALFNLMVEAATTIGIEL